MHFLAKYTPRGSSFISLPSFDDLNMTHFHCFESAGMTLRGDTCGAGGIDIDRYLRQSRLGDRSVGDHADIGTESAEGDLFNR